MSQDDTPDLATPQAGKVVPEAVALRAQPRPVTRLNRCTLAIPAGTLSVAVLGALMWSLQPQRRGAGEQTELYNVDRVSKSEGLDALPADYSKLPPPLPASVPELGPPLPGDLGPAIVKSQQPATAAAPGFAANAAFDPLAAGPASTAAQPADLTAVQNRQDQKEAFQKAGTTETRSSGNLTLPASPYQVMAGTVVAGALVTGIKSDLPGDVIASACRFASLLTAIWCCVRTSRFSSTRGLPDDAAQAAAGAAPENGIYEADLCLPGQPESRSRTLRCVVCAGLWRDCRCCDADSLHVGDIYRKR